MSNYSGTVSFLTVEKDNTVNGATGQKTDEEYAYDVLTDKLPEVVDRAYVEKI